MMPRLRLGLSDPACLRLYEGRCLHQLGPDAVIIIAGRVGGMRSGAPSVTLSLEWGAPIRLAQATLGRVSVATTGRYLHGWPTDSSARYLVV